MHVRISGDTEEGWSMHIVSQLDPPSVRATSAIDASVTHVRRRATARGHMSKGAPPRRAGRAPERPRRHRDRPSGAARGRDISNTTSKLQRRLRAQPFAGHASFLRVRPQKVRPPCPHPQPKDMPTSEPAPRARSPRRAPARSIDRLDRQRAARLHRGLLRAGQSEPLVIFGFRRPDCVPARCSFHAYATGKILLFFF